MGGATSLFFGTNGTTGELFWDDCEKKGSGTMQWGGGGLLSLVDASATGDFPVDGVATTFQFTALDTGGFASYAATLVPFQPLRDGARSDGTWSWGAFIKIGEYKFGDFKFSLLNLSVSDSGVVHEITNFAVQ